MIIADHLFRLAITLLVITGVAQLHKHKILTIPDPPIHTITAQALLVVAHFPALAILMSLSLRTSCPYTSPALLAPTHKE